MLFTCYQGSRLVGVTGLVSFYIVLIVFFFKTRLPTLSWPRNSPHPPRHPRPRLSLPRSRLESAQPGARDPLVAFFLSLACLLVFTTLLFFLYSHEVARKRFPRIAFSFPTFDLCHAFHMRFFGILFSQLFYPFGDGPCSFRNSR